MAGYGNNNNYVTNQTGNGKKSRKVVDKKYQTFEKQLLDLKKKVKNTIKNVKRLERMSKNAKKKKGRAVKKSK